MEELPSLKFHCKRQSLSISGNLLFFRCYDAKHHDWSLMLDCWHSVVFSGIILKCDCLTILLVKNGINGESYCIRKKWRFDSRDSSGHSTNGCSFPDTSEPLLHFQGVSWTGQTFHSNFFGHPAHSRVGNFFFCASLVLFWHEQFLKVLLMISWLITKSLFDRGRFFQ